jgi:hypothetical protein
MVLDHDDESGYINHDIDVDSNRSINNDTTMASLRHRHRTCLLTSYR